MNSRGPFHVRYLVPFHVRGMHRGRLLLGEIVSICFTVWKGKSGWFDDNCSRWKIEFIREFITGIIWCNRSFLFNFFLYEKKIFCYYLLFCFFLFGYLIIDKFEVLLIIFLSYMERNMSREKGKSILSIVFT